MYIQHFDMQHASSNCCNYCTVHVVVTKCENGIMQNAQEMPSQNGKKLSAKHCFVWVVTYINTIQKNNKSFPCPMTSVCQVSWQTYMYMYKLAEFEVGFGSNKPLLLARSAYQVFPSTKVPLFLRFILRTVIPFAMSLSWEVHENAVVHEVQNWKLVASRRNGQTRPEWSWEQV